MQKNVLKHQFENFSTASNESLDKAYDRFQKLISQLEVHGALISKEYINQKFLRILPSSWNQIALIMRNKPDIDEIDIDDLYNNPRVYEDELKRSSSSNYASQNLAFLFFENTGGTNEVSTASGDFGVSTVGGINQVPSTPCANDVAYSFLAQPTTSPQLENEDFEDIIIEYWNSDDEEEEYEVKTVRPETQTVKTRDDKSGQNSKKQGIVLGKPSVSTARPSVSTTRPVCTARPSVSTARPVYATRSIYPRMDNVRPRGSCSPIKRTRAVVNTGKGKLDTDLKKSRWVWRPKGNYLDHVSKDSGSFMLKKVEYVDPKGISKCDNGTEFKNHAMNEFCAKKGIKREFSVARTLQQNGVAERKNRTLIEAARTMLADSLLPIPFWAEAVNTACYVLNRVLVTKHQNKTPYELLIDSLGKFDGKSDEGYLLRYSTSSKAFRVYNKRTKRVEENLHINFLEDQPNVTGTGPNWMFDLDFLTNSMNYIPVSVENQVNVDVEDVAPAAHEKPSESSPKDNDIQDSEDVIDKEGQHQMPEDEQVLHDELEKMVTQELTTKAMDDISRQAFEEEKRRIASQKKAAQATSTNKLSTDRQSVSTDRPFVSTDRSNTPYVSAASTPTGANAGESSFVYLGGKIPIDASTLPNADLPIDPNMPDLEDASDTLPNDKR
ncbi:putative ribonuclease H-like domain-containing protein [Tanacetum coccineum]